MNRDMMVHPSAQGAGLMAQEVYHALTGKKAPASQPAGGPAAK